MAKMILISDEDLKSLIQEAVTNAVDGITKKIASRCAVYSYNNQIFNQSRPHVASAPSVGCGADDDDDYGYGGCGGGGGSHSYGGGCGSDMSGGC
jgi:hypothetical protein